MEKQKKVFTSIMSILFIGILFFSMFSLIIYENNRKEQSKLDKIHGVWVETEVLRSQALELSIDDKNVKINNRVASTKFKLSNNRRTISFKYGYKDVYCFLIIKGNLQCQISGSNYEPIFEKI